MGKRIYILLFILLVFTAMLLFGIFKKEEPVQSIEVNDKPSYTTILSKIHKIVKPQLYFEIGTSKGSSIKTANALTRIVGVDPAPAELFSDKKNIKIYKMKSDDFFADKKIIKKEFGAQKPDLIFIDGMHLYEYVLRDFTNAEKISRKNTIIILHDTLPMDEGASQRTQRLNQAWTGDVYKIYPILKKYRPDLEIEIIDTPPSGLCVIKNLDPSSEILSEDYDKIIKEFSDFSYKDIMKYHEKHMTLIQPDDGSLQKLLK